MSTCMIKDNLWMILMHDSLYFQNSSLCVKEDDSNLVFHPHVAVTFLKGVRTAFLQHPNSASLLRSSTHSFIHCSVLRSRVLG